MIQDRKEGPRVSRRGAIAGFVATAASGVLVATNMDAAVAYAQQTSVQAVAEQSGGRRFEPRGYVWPEPKGGFSESFKAGIAAVPEAADKWPDTAEEAASIFGADQKTRSQRWTRHTGDYKAHGDVPFYSVEPIEGGDTLLVDTTKRGMAEIWYPRNSDGSTFRAILHGFGITRGTTVRPLIDSCDHPQVKRQELADRVGVSIDQVEVIGFPKTLTGR